MVVVTRPATMLHWMGHARSLPRRGGRLVTEIAVYSSRDGLLGKRSFYRTARCLEAAVDKKDPADTRMAIATQANGNEYGETQYFQCGGNVQTAWMHAESTNVKMWSLWRPFLRGKDRSNQQSLLGLRLWSTRSREFLAELFLPRDYKRAVTSDYMIYTKWNFVGSVASTACGVIAMQALLYAIGLSSGTAPTAAAINWVLKDGLGQFGGVLFASLVNNRFDANPKRWRMASAIALDVAELVEILTPLVPSLFLPMASLANIAMNISWLGAGATRAGIHSSFAKSENLAEITAKSGSQTILASIVGTGLGVVISHFTGSSTTYLLAAFAVLSAAHEISIFKAVAGVSLRTVNLQRLHYLIRTYMSSNGTRLPHPDDARQREHLLPLMLRGYKSYYTRSFINGESPLCTMAPTPRDLLLLREFFSQEKYLLRVNRLSSDMYRIDLAMEERAEMEDVLLAHFHAVMIQEKLETQSRDLSATELAAIREDCYKASKSSQAGMVRLLDDSEWHSNKLLVEENEMRYRWEDK